MKNKRYHKRKTIKKLKRLMTRAAKNKKKVKMNKNRKKMKKKIRINQTRLMMKMMKIKILRRDKKIKIDNRITMI